ncbi:tyrosine-type recombinase/integrase [Acetobacterium sp. UBA5834]|uniref:tyrosine-type recombinase/integrase n=1 Tax=Acetobacterium sp. UBA5834 TaxID=1945907 RepID=UPI00257E7A13|nr:tyrosine-type recombinase/integrase [Acetobacterium sp. UBA5834]
MSEVNFQGNFRKYLLEDGKSRATIESYMGDIRKYLEWLENKQGTFEGQLSRVSITSYRNQLEQQNYAVNTINKKINSLHSFNHYLIREGFCEKLVVFPNKDKIKIANGSEKEVAVFSDDEVEQLLFFLEKKDLVSLRDRTILLTLLYTGLRVSEVVGLKIQDIDRLTMNLKVVGKGGKYRELPIKPELAETIKSYLETERKDSPFASSDYLFVTQRAKKMDTDTVNKLLNKHGKALGMILYPHKFRHTFCTRLLKKGVDLTTVAKLAGHANIQTTASFYINTSREDKQEAVGLL